MKINQKIKKQLRWQNSLFIILFLSIISLLAWFSVQYEFEADWTNNKRNTPSEASLALLEKVDEPIAIRSFVSRSNKTLLADIRRLIQGYQRQKTNITLTFIDPTLEPGLVREFGVRNEGELLVSIGDRQEHLLAATEKNLTNAIQRLARTQNHWLLFLEGHDERSPYGDTSFDYSSWYSILKNKGLQVRTYNLANNPNIPVNTAALVIADPQKNFLAGEIQIIQNFLSQGGNLLWLLEPGSLQNLEAIAEVLGIEPITGIVVDPNTQILGINDPRFTLIPEYPRNSVTQDLESMSILPTAQAFDIFDSDGWAAQPLLETLPRTWSESDDILTDMLFDPASDTAGPLVIGLSLTRTNLLETPSESRHDTTDNTVDYDIALNESDSENQHNQQRVVIIGDSDFSSNAYLGQAGNLDLSMSLINWLVKEDAFINIPHKTNIDNELNLSKTDQMIIGFSFILIIPLTLMLSGLFIWFKRRKS